MLIGGCTICLAVFSLVGLFVYRAAQAEPEFYQRALTHSAPEQQERHGNELEQQLFELHQEAVTSGRWQATFTEDRINGWLASDLPLKFPQVLPIGVKDPRVAINEDRIQAACRYESPRISTVISFELNVELSDEPNTVAVRVSQVRAGRVPIPLKPFLDRIAAVAQTTEIPFRWAETEGDPVAMITIPTQHKDYLHREVHVETVEFREGEVSLSGHTEGPRRLASHSSQELVRLALHSPIEIFTIQR